MPEPRPFPSTSESVAIRFRSRGVERAHRLLSAPVVLGALSVLAGLSVVAAAVPATRNWDPVPWSGAGVPLLLANMAAEPLGAAEAPTTAPTVRSVSPSSLPPGAAHQDVTINGSGFAGGAVVGFAAGSGVTVTAVRYLGSTALVANVMVSSSAPLAPTTVTVTVQGVSGSCVACLSVSDHPSFGGSAASLPQGASQQTIVVAGKDFMPGAGAAILGSSGVSIDTLDVESPESLALTVSVPPGAGLGQVPLILLNPVPGLPGGGCGTCLSVSDTPVVERVSAPGATGAAGGVDGGSRAARSGTGAASLPDGVSGQDLVVSGSNFMPEASVTFGAGTAGVNADAVSYESPSELIVSTTVKANAPLGTVVVSVANVAPRTPVGSCLRCFSVSDTPVVSSVTVAGSSAASLPPGAAHQDVVIAGADFMAGASVAIDGATDATVEAVRVDGPEQIVATVSVDATAAPEPLTVSVLNAGAGAPAGTCTTCLSVSSTPVIAGVDAASLPPGASHVDEAVSGADFMPGATASFVAGGGVTVNSVTYAGPGSLVVNVTVAGTAAGGSAAITVTNPAVEGSSDQSTTCSTCVSVATVPVVETASPSSYPPGAAYANVTLSGSDFTGGASVNFGDPSTSGVTVDSVSFEGPSEMILSITVASSAAAGVRTVTVTAPGGGAPSGSCATCFAVG